MRAGWVLLLLAGCDPYAVWPAPHEVFPWVFTPETDLPAYADVRVETETWVPLKDLEETALYIQKATYHPAYSYMSRRSEKKRREEKQLRNIDWA